MATTTATTDERLRYPIGNFRKPEAFTAEIRKANIAALRELPAAAAAAVEGLTDEQLDTPYRPGGWTVRQTIHHIADSHVNSFCRFKLALTEDVPTIRPYLEDRWARLADSRLAVGPSLLIIEGVHARLTALLDSLAENDFARELEHPDTGRWTLDGLLALYAWHGRHHVAHITELWERNGW